jgi:transcriptional antiterminator
MNNLKMRLEILRMANTIDLKDEQLVFEVISFLGEQIDVEINEENYSMITMHLAMAISRKNKNELVNEIESIVHDAIKVDVNYDRAVELTNSLLDIIELDHVEHPYIHMHVATILSKEVVC